MVELAMTEWRKSTPPKLPVTIEVNGVLGALQTDLSADVREDLADLLSR